jgi:transposase
VGGAEARSHGRGGIIAATARATGMHVEMIRLGLRELEAGETLPVGRVRRPGGGRKSLTEKDPTLLLDLERLVDEDSRGDPERPLRWTAKSVRKLADELRGLGHRVHFTSVAKLLRSLGYSLQANVKAKEGSQHRDRDAQFGHINTVVAAALQAGEPVISVDTKKKELVEDFKNAGREWRPKGSPIPVGLSATRNSCRRLIWEARVDQAAAFAAFGAFGHLGVQQRAEVGDRGLLGARGFGGQRAEAPPDGRELELDRVRFDERLERRGLRVGRGHRVPPRSWS